MEELERQGRHKKRLETSIAEMGEKIVCVVDQNNRFIEHFDAFESELNQITEEIIDSGSQTKEFRNACIDTRGELRILFSYFNGRHGKKEKSSFCEKFYTVDKFLLIQTLKIEFSDIKLCFIPGFLNSKIDKSKKFLYQ